LTTQLQHGILNKIEKAGKCPPRGTDVGGAADKRKRAALDRDYQGRDEKSQFGVKTQF